MATLQIATHNGSFHADDVFGVAVLQLLHPGAELIRTRDPRLIAEAPFAVDVGGEWDGARGRFDHHQRGFDGRRPNGVVYASAGLVWAAHGAALVERLFDLQAPTLAQAIADDLDEQLVQHLDRADTGASHGAPGLFGLSALIGQFNATWDHPGAGDKDGQAHRDGSGCFTRSPASGGFAKAVHRFPNVGSMDDFNLSNQTVSCSAVTTEATRSRKNKVYPPPPNSKT